MSPKGHKNLDQEVVCKSLGDQISFYFVNSEIKKRCNSYI